PYRCCSLVRASRSRADARSLHDALPISARHRGQPDLVVNGSFWVGAALGAVGSVVLLEPGRLPLDMGWRLAFGIGAALGIVILFLRRHIPESPRWLMTHGRVEEAEAIVAAIEAQARRAPVDPRDPRDPRKRHAAGLRLAALPRRTTLRDVVRTLLSRYRRRTVVGLVLMASQAFFY